LLIATAIAAALALLTRRGGRAIATMLVLPLAIPRASAEPWPWPSSWAATGARAHDHVPPLRHTPYPTEGATLTPDWLEVVQWDSR
jgi:hypothetical protein